MRTKGTKIRSRGTDSPLTNPFLSLAVLDTNLDFSGAKNPNPYCAQIRSQGSRRRICPHRLAVPEKIFALPACSIFSTAAGAPPRFIRHWRRSAPHPLPLPRSGGGAVWANSCLFKFRSRQRDFLRCTPWPIGSPHPNRRDPLSLQNRATNPSFSSPIKPTIYAKTTHKSPIL